MRTRIAFGLLCAALLFSMFVNFRLYQLTVRQQHLAPLSEWMMRLSINRDVIIDSGNTLSDQTLEFVQKSIYMDLSRIKKQEQTNPGRFGPARIERLQAILDSLNTKRIESPELFAPPRLNMTDERFADYINLISTSDR